MKMRRNESGEGRWSKPRKSVCVCVCLRRQEEGVIFPETGVTGDFESPNMDTGSGTPFLC